MRQKRLLLTSKEISRTMFWGLTAMGDSLFTLKRPMSHEIGAEMEPEKKDIFGQNHKD
jgi:hypothetical protein